jgi:hypothetical protein
LVVRCRADLSARHSSFYRHAWTAIAKVGLPGIYLQDLRRAGNTLTADAGASLRELMDRMGRSSTRAALIYQRSSDERQRKLADAVSKAPRAALPKTGIASGTEKWHEAQVRCHETWRARQDSNPRPAA